MSTIATWNVNSVNARLPNVLTWLDGAKPDIVLLQEIKCLDAAFPTEAIGELGYNAVTHGQKSYNGVAILSRHRHDLAWFPWLQRRLAGVAATVVVQIPGVVVVAHQ